MTKKIPTRWKSIVLVRKDPDVYPRYYRRQPGFAQLVPGQHFFNDDKHSWCEFFFEKINNEFWMHSMEVRAKDNNHYIFESKRGMEDYFSINILSSGAKIGCLDHAELHWADSQVIFSKPGASTHVYLEKGQVLKCCRLIFKGSYLTYLADPGFTGGLEEAAASSADRIFQSPPWRMASTVELFLQSRLFNILKYERKKQHYKSSVFSILFELTAFFLKLSADKETAGDFSAEDQTYTMEKAAKILEQKFMQKFPGINWLASSCNVSVSKLKRDFKKVHGTTPMEYFRRVQIKYVLDMMESGEKTKKELASELGFKKSSTFSLWYKKTVNEMKL